MSEPLVEIVGTPLERAMGGAVARRLAQVPIKFGEMWSVEDCPPELLEHLALAVSVDVWDVEWPEPTKRAVIARSIALHRAKGTLGSVQGLLKAAGYGDAEILEGPTLARAGAGQRAGDGLRAHLLTHWAQYQVRLTQPINRRAADLLRVLLASVAPVRCALARIVATLGIEAGEGRAAGAGWTAGGTVIVTSEDIQ
ncbi:MAG: phage tail protein I [Paracoccaceae bacterium]